MDQQSLPLEVSSLLPCFTSSPLSCISEAMESDSSRSLSSTPIPISSMLRSMIELTDNQWFGFKVVGDNIDKTVRPRHETMKHHSQSLHYFHSYAVRDRVDLSLFSDEPTQVDMHAYVPELLLPSQEDLQHMLQNFTVLITRVLVGYMPCFEKFSDKIVKHIPHKFTSEITKKSHVVNFVTQVCCMKLHFTSCSMCRFLLESI